MRTSVAGAAVLVVSAVLAPVATASAAGESCAGETATAVGILNSLIVGTDGRDVVVTNGAAVVKTGNGDDLVCITPGPGGPPISGPTTPLTVIVSTGPGDDTVASEGTPAPGSVHVALGSGSDTFTGRASQVDAGEPAPSGPQADAERDVIDVRPASPGYTTAVSSGQDGLPNADVVRLPEDGQVFWSGQPADGTELTAAGGGELWTPLPSGDVVADLATGSLAAAGATPLRFTGFATFDLVATAATTGLRVSGSDGRDDVSLHDLTSATRLDVSLGSGADVLRTTTASAPDSAVDGGGGRDRLSVESTHSLRVDLARHRAGDLAVRGFEDVAAVARSVTVRGDARGNRVEVAACRVAVSGGGGADQLLTVYDYPQLVETSECSSPRTVSRIDGGAGKDRLVAQRAGDDVLRGGAGDDRLIGGRGDDTLLGGAGRDRVIGGVGRDVCDGERVNGCERRR